MFPSAEILDKNKNQVCMTFDSISGPRQCRSLQKLEVSSSLVVWDCVPQQLSWEESCACVDFVGGFGNCKLIFLTTGGVLC